MQPSCQLRGDGPSLNTNPWLLSWAEGEERILITMRVGMEGQSRQMLTLKPEVHLSGAQKHSFKQFKLARHLNATETGETSERGLCRFLSSKGCELSRKSNKQDRNNLLGQMLFQLQTEEQPTGVYWGELSAQPTWTMDGTIFMKDVSRSWKKFFFFF